MPAGRDDGVFEGRECGARGSRLRGRGAERKRLIDIDAALRRALVGVGLGLLEPGNRCPPGRTIRCRKGASAVAARNVLVEIDVALRRALVGVGLGLLEKFVELPGPNLL